MTALSQPSLSGGEISPSLYGRIDLARYLTSLRTCRNFIPLSYGGAKNRAGTRFVEEVKDSSKFTRLIPFQFSTDQAYVLEMGEEYGRVFRNGARVTLLATPAAWATGTAYVLGNHVAQGGVNYYCAIAHTSGTFATDLAAGDWYALTDDIVEFPTEWLEGDLPILKTTQSADVLTLCHVDYHPTNISRTAHDTWTVEPITFEFGPFEDVNADTSITVFPSTTSGTGITLTSSSALFTAADVGKLFYLEQKDYGQSWEAGVTVAVNDIRRAEGKYYRNLAGTTTGTLRPTNDTDNWNDGKCNWMFLHPGFGIALITAYTSATAVTATAVTRLPDAMVGASAYAAGTTYAAAAQVYDGLIAYVSLAGSNTGHTPASSPTWWTPISTYKWAKGVWNEADGYPGCTTYHQQRHAFAGSPKQPQTVWMSKTADFTNFGKSSPIVDDDTLTYPLAGKQVNQVRHMVSLGGALIALTSDSNWTITGNESGGVLTPSVVQAKPQSYLGSSDVPPLTVGNKAIYVQDKGGVVRDLGYEYASDSFTGTDLSILASHLLEGHSITDWAYQQAPFGVIWAVRDDGLLLSLTYQKEQDVFAWAHHDLGEGLVESCCVVSQGLEDVLYLIVNRTIGGATKRYIERMENRVITDILDAFFVDSGLSYDGRNTTATTMTVSGGVLWDQTETVTITASASSFVAGDVGDAIVFVEDDWTRYAFTIQTVNSGTEVLAVPNKTIPVAYRNTARADWNFARINLFGLDHLEGETVAVFMDGNEHPQCVVSGGEVVLERPGYYVHIGLPITADLETLDLAVYGGETIRDKKKLVSKVSVQVESTRGLFVGTDALHLKEWKQSHATLSYDEPMPLETGLAEVCIPGTWDKNGRVFIRQSSPLPMQILALIPEVSVGGS